MSKITRRWCIKHARDWHKSDYATPNGPANFRPDLSSEWKVLLRLNYLGGHLDPDDNVAFQEVCREFNKPQVGSPMDPPGVVICVIAHAVKWPPAVRHFLCILRKLSKTQAVTAKVIVDAFYDTVLWADNKPLNEMHAVLSVAGRAHALTGLAVSAGQLGVIANRNNPSAGGRLISLGPAGRE